MVVVLKFKEGGTSDVSSDFIGVGKAGGRSEEVIGEGKAGGS